jgi:hypothetical protein
VVPPRSPRLAPTGDEDRPGVLPQWIVLQRRNLDILRRNRLTLAIMLGAPVLVIAMFTMLFRRGALEPGAADATAAISTTYWMAFAAFFFGLTYGLLQVVGEMAVLRRERLAGLSVAAYVLSKITVLAPVLAVVAAVLLGVLRALDRLPSLGWEIYTSLFITLLVESLAALALGLLTSAAVADAAQATLALPMLCFPQVLFGGAVVPVADMAVPGQLVSVGMTNRWAFESLGRSLHLEALANELPTVAAYGNAFGGPAASGWAVLAGSALVLTVATMWVLHRRCLPS